jgi:hypothetical protein
MHLQSLSSLGGGKVLVDDGRWTMELSFAAMALLCIKKSLLKQKVFLWT